VAAGAEKDKVLHLGIGMVTISVMNVQKSLRPGNPALGAFLLAPCQILTFTDLHPLPARHPAIEMPPVSGAVTPEMIVQVTILFSQVVASCNPA